MSAHGRVHIVGVIASTLDAHTIAGNDPNEVKDWEQR